MTQTTNPHSPIKSIEAMLAGESIRKIEHAMCPVWGPSWHFTISAAILEVRCPWRIISDDRVRFASPDHLLKTGLTPEPLDGIAQTEVHLKDVEITSANTNNRTGDLTLTFANGATVEIWTRAIGPLGWRLTTRDGTIYSGNGSREIYTITADEDFRLGNR